MPRVMWLVGLLALMSVPARADIIVSVGDATVEVGGTAFLDVLISSTGSDPLQAFGFDFSITGGPRRLEFVDPQPDPQLTDSDYVFFLDSAANINTFPVGTVSTNVVPNDTFIGGDSTNSLADVSLTTSKLVARLQVDAASGLPPIVGDTFSVTLSTPGSFNLGDNTYFIDNAFNDLDFDAGSSDLVGAVTVVAAASAVPEPSSFLIAGVLLLAYLCYRRFPRAICVSRLGQA